MPAKKTTNRLMQRLTGRSTKPEPRIMPKVPGEPTLWPSKNPKLRAAAASQSKDLSSGNAAKYPETVENLYLECGIASAYEINHIKVTELNKLLEKWAFANPVSAAFAWDLVESSRMIRSNPELHLLHECALWKRTFPGLHQQQDDAAGKSKNLADVNPHFRQEMFLSSDLRKPVGQQYHAVVLPLPVLDLYMNACEIREEDISRMSFNQVQTMITHWKSCYPVSDYHLKQVIDTWNPKVGPKLSDPYSAEGGLVKAQREERLRLQDIRRPDVPIERRRF